MDSPKVMFMLEFRVLPMEISLTLTSDQKVIEVHRFLCRITHKNPYPQMIYIAQILLSSVWQHMNSMKLVIPLHLSSWKKTHNDAVTPQRQSQFTPKMKANAVPRLLSSLVWIDQYNECNRMTSFMELMYWVPPLLGINIIRDLLCTNYQRVHQKIA